MELVMPAASEVVQMISQTEPKWQSLTLADKFCLVCGFMMYVEQRVLAHNSPAETEIEMAVTRCLTELLAHKVLETEPLCDE